MSSGSYAAWTDGQVTTAFPGESNCDFGIFGGCHSFVLDSFFDTYAILADPRATQGCHEIKAIMAFSFLTWILRNTLRFERSRMPLTV